MTSRKPISTNLSHFMVQIKSMQAIGLKDVLQSIVRTAISLNSTMRRPCKDTTRYTCNTTAPVACSI